MFVADGFLRPMQTLQQRESQKRETRTSLTGRMLHVVIIVVGVLSVSLRHLSVFLSRPFQLLSLQRRL